MTGEPHVSRTIVEICEAVMRGAGPAELAQYDRVRNKVSFHDALTGAVLLNAMEYPELARDIRAGIHVGVTTPFGGRIRAIAQSKLAKLLTQFT